jgi:hypothetical protein
MLSKRCYTELAAGDLKSDRQAGWKAERQAASQPASATGDPELISGFIRRTQERVFGSHDERRKIEGADCTRV